MSAKIQVSTNERGAVSVVAGWAVVGMSPFSERAQRIAAEFREVGYLSCEWADVHSLVNDETLSKAVRDDIVSAVRETL